MGQPFTLWVPKMEYTVLRSALAYVQHAFQHVAAHNGYMRQSADKMLSYDLVKCLASGEMSGPDYAGSL